MHDIVLPGRAMMTSELRMLTWLGLRGVSEEKGKHTGSSIYGFLCPSCATDEIHEKGMSDGCLA